MNCPSEFTVDELVAYLKRSDLPAVLVEGRDDMTIYRWIEEKSPSCLGAVIPCGGRSQVLEIARKQDELGSKKVAFLVDSDTDSVWETTESIPNTIWTAGYSIENDLLSSGVITSLMTNEERSKFLQAVDSLACWFLGCVLLAKEGQPSRLCRHSRDVLDHDSFILRDEQEIDSSLEELYSDACEKVREQPLVFVRGKNLFDSALFFLSSRRRRSKYSRQNLYELCSINHKNSPELSERLARVMKIIEPTLEN